MTRPVLFDLQAIQSLDQRHRGIPRYVLELALALEETAPAAVDAYLLNPDRALPEEAERLAAGGKLCFPEDVDWETAGLLHIASPLDTTLPPHRQLPLGARRARVPRVVTLHDVIPYLFPELYLEDAGMSRRYRARLQLLRTTAAILTNSATTRLDVIEHLGLDPGRVFVAGSGTGPQFVPPESRAVAAAAAAAAVPGLRVPFVFYVGSYERRKNLEPLLEAWSLLPAAVRGRWQLAVCCPLQPLQLNHLEYRAGQMGIGPSEVCFTGFVPDEVLLLLHQGTDLFVFPSLYEGYGLPVAEALACGAAALAADSSSLPEIVGPEALFDPSDPAAMARAIERGLTDEGLRGQLLARAGRPPSTWAEVAEVTAAVYDRVLSGELGVRVPERPGPRVFGERPGVRGVPGDSVTPAVSGLRVALVAPWPPDGGGWGEWSYRLAEDLAGRPGNGESPNISLEVFADRLTTAGREVRRLAGPPGVPVHPLGALEAVEDLEGDFDAVVYLLADDEFHTGSLAALRRRAGSDARSIVMAHDVRLPVVYGQAARSGGLPEGLEALIRSAYGNVVRGRSRPIPGVVPGVGKGEVLSAGEARRRGILFTRDVLAHSGRFLVTSEVDAALARLEARPAGRDKIGVVAADPAGAASALSSELAGRRPPAPVTVTPVAGPVVYELQATQSFDTRHRGIARYAMELALAIEQVHPERVGAYAVNPDLPLPDGIERLAATGKLVYSDEVDWARVGLFHSASLLEMMAPLDRVLPPGVPAAGVPVVVSFYDLIPYLFPEHYLEDPGWRRRYRARLPHLRRATAVLSLSEATRVDGIEHLGLDPERVFVVGSGTGPQFVPPESRAAAAAAAAAAVPGLRVPYVFYIGSYEQRKNLVPLMEAWSLLPAAVRGRWQLVVCCPLQPLQLHHLRYLARQMGIGPSEVCFTGFVPDEVLLLLHQGTDLFVFPSLYEGYGLPVAEALACGAAVLAADSSSLPEILGPEALFDATDPRAMAAAIERGLTDEGLRAQLLARAGRPPSTWVDVAEATVAVYDRVLSGELSRGVSETPGVRGVPETPGVRGVPETPGVRGVPETSVARAASGLRVALVAPWPPDGGGWADWSYRLAGELAGHPTVDVHVFADRPATAGREVRRLEGPPGVVVHPLGALEAVEELEGDFDAVVVLLADDEFHTGSLAALRRRAGSDARSIVVAHDVRLAVVYGHAARSGGLPEGLEELIRTAYGEGVAPGVGADNVLSAEEARRRGILLTRDALAHSERFLLTSENAAAVARLEAHPADRAKIDVVDADPAGLADALYAELAGG